jgi:molybdenum cofactor cytidylyltransferase
VTIEKGAAEAGPVVVILAAGRSSRMGFPKALAPIGGELALARILRIARLHRLPVKVVLGFGAAEIRARIALDASDVVVNDSPLRGQSSSLRAGAAAVAAGSAIALWPVDHAHVAAATFAKLLDAFRARRPGIALVVPSHGGRRGHPLFADDSARGEFAQLLDSDPGHVIVRRDPRRVAHVLVDDPAVVGDFDTPEELARLQKSPPDLGDRGGPAGAPRPRGGPKGTPS